MTFNKLGLSFNLTDKFDKLLQYDFLIRNIQKEISFVEQYFEVCGRLSSVILKMPKIRKYFSILLERQIFNRVLEENKYNLPG